MAWSVRITRRSFADAIEPRIAAQGREDRIDAKPRGRQVAWHRQHLFEQLDRAVVLARLNKMRATWYL